MNITYDVIVEKGHFFQHLPAIISTSCRCLGDSKNFTQKFHAASRLNVRWLDSEKF